MSQFWNCWNLGACVCRESSAKSMMCVYLDWSEIKMIFTRLLLLYTQCAVALGRRARAEKSTANAEALWDYKFSPWFRRLDLLSCLMHNFWQKYDSTTSKISSLLTRQVLGQQISRWWTYDHRFRQKLTLTQNFAWGAHSRIKLKIVLWIIDSQKKHQFLRMIILKNLSCFFMADSLSISVFEGFVFIQRQVRLTQSWYWNCS